MRYLYAFATGSLDFARDDGVFSCELPQKAQIILRKQADVGNVEQDHRQPIHPETEGKTSPFFRIISIVPARLVDRFENGGMDHAAATDLDPLFSAPQGIRIPVDFATRVRVKKINWAKIHRGVGHEKLTHVKMQKAIRVGEDVHFNGGKVF